MSFDSAHLLSQLSALNREEGDFKLKCDGAEIKAHSFILSLRSKYFATALTTGVGNAKSKSEMEVMDCSHKVLTCIVNFMYGFPIPEDFDDHQGLLHQADLFMMEDLKSAVGLRIAKNLSLETLREIVLLAESYRAVKLQESCGEFILAHMEELDDGLLAELALPPSARVAFEAVKANQREKNSKEALISHITDLGEKILGITVNPDQFKKRTDFPDDPIEYKAYVRGHIQANMLVRCCETFSYTKTGTSSTYTALVGDFGRTLSPQYSTVQVKWENGITSGPKDCFVNLELITGPLNTTLLSNA